MYPEGGYKTQTVTQIANLLHAYDEGRIEVRALRVYLAALCMKASREAAERSRTKQTKKGRVTPQYKLLELSRLTGMPLTGIRKEIRSLKSASLMEFSASEITFTETSIPGSVDLLEALSFGRSRARPVPLPRTMLRYLAKCSKISTLKTVLSYCVRGLTLAQRGGEVTGKGSVKASWIAGNMGLSVRSVRSVRAELIALGWISADESSTQWKLNRTGAYFSINLSWKGKDQKNSKRVSQRGGSEGVIKSPVAEGRPVENSLSTCLNFSPPPLENEPEISPPYKEKKTSSYEESNNQKTPTGEKRPGVFIKSKKGRGRSLFDVKREDLFSFTRVEALYFEACELGLVNPCESSALNVLSAAIRARNAAIGEPSRIFAGLIRRKLFHHIAQAEEDQARKALVKYREEDSRRFMFCEYRKAA